MSKKISRQVPQNQNGGHATSGRAYGMEKKLQIAELVIIQQQQQESNELAFDQIAEIAKICKVGTTFVRKIQDELDSPGSLQDPSAKHAIAELAMTGGPKDPNHAPLPHRWKNSLLDHIFGTTTPIKSIRRQFEGGLVAVAGVKRCRDEEPQESPPPLRAKRPKPSHDCPMEPKSKCALDSVDKDLILALYTNNPFTNLSTYTDFLYPITGKLVDSTEIYRFLQSRTNR